MSNNQDKPYQIEYDPKDLVTVYHGMVGMYYSIQVSCSVPVVGITIQRTVMIPPMMSQNRMCVDKHIGILKYDLTKDIQKRLKDWREEQQ